MLFDRAEKHLHILRTFTSSHLKPEQHHTKMVEPNTVSFGRHSFISVHKLKFGYKFLHFDAKNAFL